MPGGDHTGPRREGPRTGWGLGDCTGNEQSYAANRPFGRRGRGFRGRGFNRRGWRNRFYDTGRFKWESSAYDTPSAAQDQDLESLKAQAKELQDALKGIQARLDEIES